MTERPRPRRTWHFLLTRDLRSSLSGATRLASSSYTTKSSRPGQETLASNWSGLASRPIISLLFPNPQQIAN